MKRIVYFIFFVSLTLCLCGCQNGAGAQNFAPQNPALPPTASAGPSVSAPAGSVNPTPTPTPTPTVTVSPVKPPESTAQATVTYAISTVNGLAVRQGASTSSPKMGVLNAGDGVAFLGEENGFIKTVYKQQTAYVWAGYCKQMHFARAEESVENVIGVGATLLGYPYVWGSQRYHWGNGVKNTDFVAGEFDCSALMQYAFYHGNGALLSLTSRTQSTQGKGVARAQIQRGDLLFFTNASRKDKTGTERVGHVALYLGGNYILHTASDYAVIEEISAQRWAYYVCARRISV